MDNPGQAIAAILAMIGLGVLLKPLMPLANRIFERIMVKPEHRSKT